MSEIFFRVVTRNDGSSWVYRDNKPYCGPFESRGYALDAAYALEAGLRAFPEAKP
jgi:hypothetical protein